MVFGRESPFRFPGTSLKQNMIATLMRSRDPSAEFSDMAGKALSVEWLVENAPTVFTSR